MTLRRWHIAALVGVLIGVLVVKCAAAQVTAVAELRSGIATVSIGNPSTGPLHVTVALHRDATPDSGAVTLGAPVDVLISPASFTLQPGEIQTVRLRVREPVAPGELLRLVTTLDPRSQPDSMQTMRLVVRTRLITKVRAVP